MASAPTGSDSRFINGNDVGAHEKLVAVHGTLPRPHNP
jgi:hypothetical protein